jgi:nucleoid DNA-binding protein
VTKTEFIDEVAERAGLSKKDASAAVDAVLETIEGEVLRWCSAEEGRQLAALRYRM